MRKMLRSDSLWSLRRVIKGRPSPGPVNIVSIMLRSIPPEKWYTENTSNNDEYASHFKVVFEEHFSPSIGHAMIKGK
jgi:hypothetical protein